MNVNEAIESVSQSDRLGSVSVTLHTAQALVAEVQKLRAERSRLLDEAAERAVQYLRNNLVAWEPEIMTEHCDELRAAVSREAE